MRIIISFDTEDFTDPATNDVLLRIAETLTGRGVRASFGLVGEKARFLRDEGRWDVIEALDPHSICYHSDNHFLFPDERHPLRFASEIVEKCDWDEAVSWLVSSEARGIADVESLFGRRPTTFLRTCADHAPQILEAYRQLGIKTFAYYAYQPEHDNRHISRFCNNVCVSLPIVREELTYTARGPAELDRLAAEGEDLINVRFHPCRFIADSWWSILSFQGKEHPRTRPPYPIPEHVAPEETTRRIEHLGALVDYARDRHGATFTTYDDVTAETPQDPLWLTRSQVAEAARSVRRRMSFADVGSVTLTLAESFAAITWANLHERAERIPLRRLIGPVELPPSEAVSSGRALPAKQIEEACRAAEEVIASMGRVPEAVKVGDGQVAPAAYLRAAAARLLGEQSISIEPASAFPEGMDEELGRWDEGDRDLLCWFVDRGHHMPRTALAVKLQYWTYKPAELPGRA